MPTRKYDEEQRGNVVQALRAICVLASGALCDMDDVLEYGSMDKVEEEREALVSTRNKLRIVLERAREALEETRDAN